jgi:cephalosporin hydroxylase
MTLSSTIKERVTELKFHKSVMAVRQLKKSLADAYPSMLLRWSKARRDLLVAEFNKCSTVEECIEFTQRHMNGGSCQIPWEIQSALKLIGAASPKVMCEIGTFDGGTSLLFIRFLSTLEVMVCIDLHVKNKEILKLLAPPNLQLQFLDMPSYSERTVSKVIEFLKGRMIDALFIDGDHRYEGVKKDFLFYRRFVKDGGQILFHDIVQEKGLGRAWAGGVPKIWKELSPHYPHREFIQNPEQAGFGIGSLTYSSAVQPPVSMPSQY